MIRYTELYTHIHTQTTCTYCICVWVSEHRSLSFVLCKMTTQRRRTLEASGRERVSCAGTYIYTLRALMATNRAAFGDNVGEMVCLKQKRAAELMPMAFLSVGIQCAREHQPTQMCNVCAVYKYIRTYERTHVRPYVRTVQYIHNNLYQRLHRHPHIGKLRIWPYTFVFYNNGLWAVVVFSYCFVWEFLLIWDAAQYTVDDGTHTHTHIDKKALSEEKKKERYSSGMS